MERGGRQCVEMENNSNRNLSIFSNYFVQVLWPIFLFFSLTITDALQ